MTALPQIIRIEWTPASEILGREERGISQWLADNLWLLEDALELDGLTLVDREVRIERYRADLVATADDGTEEGLPVIVENQYDKTNHDHLGKLVTYLAAWQRGLGVWIAEEASAAHIAAVDTLNRTSTGEIAYALLVLRFAPGPNDTYYVDADVLARPIAWREAVTEDEAARRSGAPERLAFLEAVHEHVDEPLTSAGWEHTRLLSTRPHIRLWLPTDALGSGGYATLRAARHEFAFRHVVVADSLEDSERTVARLRERYEARLSAELPEGTGVHWHDGRDRANAANDQIRFAHPRGGYRDIDPEDAAEWAVAVCGLWVQLLLDHPQG